MRNTILTLTLMLFLGSCDDILDRDPVDSLTTDQAFATEENLRMYINSLYELDMTLPSGDQIVGWPRFGGHDHAGDKASDLTFAADVVETYYRPDLYRSENEPWWTWTELRRINYFLSNYQKADIPQSRKNHYAGIARWFRAKFYFDKVKRFGDVPWFSHPLGSNDSDLYKARDPRVLVMDSVLADLNFAVEHIDDTKDNSSTTITKWVALGLKSRICLFEGTFRKYHPELGLGDVNAWLQHAADAAGAVMESGVYSLHMTGNPEKDYHALFISDDAVSDEVMLAHAYDEQLQVRNTSTYTYSNVGGRYMTSLIKRFVNTYLTVEGTPFTDIPGYDTIFFSREFNNRDLRLMQTIRTPFYVRTDGSTPVPYGPNSPTLYHPIKWSQDDPIWDGREGQNVNDITLMRYAEILLNYAEAKAELGTFTSGDWDDTIGSLRARAGITNTAMPATLDPYMKANFYEDVTSIAIMEIRRERAIELILERFRWDDLLRWKQADNLEKELDGIYVPEMERMFDLNGDGTPDITFVEAVPDNPVTGVYYYVIDGSGTRLSEGTKGRLILKANMVKEFPDYKYFAPIPREQLQLNANLKQNPGWGW